MGRVPPQPGGPERLGAPPREAPSRILRRYPVVVELKQVFLDVAARAGSCGSASHCKRDSASGTVQVGPPKWERAKWDLARPHRRPHTKYARTRAQESTATHLPTYLGYSAIWSGRSSCGRQFEKRSQRMSAAQPMHTHAHVCLRTPASASAHAAALTSRSGRGAWAASRAEPLLLLATACVASRAGCHAERSHDSMARGSLHGPPRHAL